MTTDFLHGVEVIEIDTGPRPVRTVRSSVIGLVGTAPNAAPATAAGILLGAILANTAIQITADTAGAAGNAIGVSMTASGASQALAVSYSGSVIQITLATDAQGVAISTAAEVVTQINASDAPVTASDDVGASDGSGVMRALTATLRLTGGADEPFPLNTPVLVAGQRGAVAQLDTTGAFAGTLPGALEGIFDQIGAVVVIVRVEEGLDEAATLANVVGGTNATTGQLEGVHALAGALGVTGFQPRILCAPGWTHQRPGSLRNPVVAELVGIAERMRAVIIADGPNTTQPAAVAYREDWGSDRIFIVDPWVTVFRGGLNVSEPASARVAGVIARTDNDLGFWWSPSNKRINGILGTTRPVDFQMGNPNSAANLVNEIEIATIIRDDGYRLWGNRSTADDPQWALLSVRRTADIIADSLQRAHRWAVDRAITATFVEAVTESVNAYLRDLKAQEAILGGECWADPDLNTPSSVSQGRVYFNFDFTPPYPAERITFRQHLVTDYIEEVFADASA